MTRLGFLIARLTGDEAALERLSDSSANLLAELAGKRVALMAMPAALRRANMVPR